jgi:hypothetical protein
MKEIGDIQRKFANAFKHATDRQGAQREPEQHSLICERTDHPYLKRRVDCVGIEGPAGANVWTAGSQSWF